MTEIAKLILPEGHSLELPVIEGSENEKAIDITKLRSETGFITMDPGYANTGSCISNITYSESFLHTNIFLEFQTCLYFFADSFLNKNSLVDAKFLQISRKHQILC